MAVIPMLFSGWWDDRMDNPLASSRIISKPIDCARLPGGSVLTIGDRPRTGGRKRCQRSSGCDKEVEQEQPVPAKKSPADFQINLDIHQFKPEEISVKATGSYVIVEGKHEQKDVEDGYALRHFVRRYQLPEGHDNEQITSTLSSDGILTVRAPRKVLTLPEQKQERTISVQKPQQPDQNKTKNDVSSRKNYTLEDLHKHE